MDDVGDDFPTKDEGDRNPLYYHMHVGAITFYLSLTLCGQLSSSDQSALFIPCKDLSLIFTFIIDPSVFTYDSALSFLLICVQRYMGPCVVLVPTGTVHSNNEFEFEFDIHGFHLHHCPLTEQILQQKNLLSLETKTYQAKANTKMVSGDIYRDPAGSRG